MFPRLYREVFGDVPGKLLFDGVLRFDFQDERLLTFAGLQQGVRQGECAFVQMLEIGDCECGAVVSEDGAQV